MQRLAHFRERHWPSSRRQGLIIHEFSVKQSSTASANTEFGLIVRLSTECITASTVKILCIWTRRIVDRMWRMVMKAVYRRVAVQSISRRRVLSCVQDTGHRSCFRQVDRKAAVCLWSWMQFCMSGDLNSWCSMGTLLPIATTIPYSTHELPRICCVILIRENIHPHVADVCVRYLIDDNIETLPLSVLW